MEGCFLLASMYSIRPTCPSCCNKETTRFRRRGRKKCAAPSVQFKFFSCMILPKFPSPILRNSTTLWIAIFLQLLSLQSLDPYETRTSLIFSSLYIHICPCSSLFLLTSNGVVKEDNLKSERRIIKNIACAILRY